MNPINAAAGGADPIKQLIEMLTGGAGGAGGAGGCSGGACSKVAGAVQAGGGAACGVAGCAGGACGKMAQTQF